MHVSRSYLIVCLATCIAAQPAMAQEAAAPAEVSATAAPTPAATAGESAAISDVGARVANDSALNLVVANGNSRSQTYSASHETKIAWSADLLKANLKYLQSRTGDVDSAKNYEASLRYERTLGVALNTFVGQGLQSDIFGGYNQRYNSDAGFKYFFRKETAKQSADKDLNWFVEAGYRFIRTNPTQGLSKNEHAARVYHEVEKYLSPSVSVKHSVEYIPSFTEAKNWQLNSELSLSAALNDVFSSKTGLALKYDNVPDGKATVKADTLLTSGIVAKF